MTAEQKEKAVTLAKSLIGKPYKYGAAPDEAPDFFDCSSFTQYLFKQIGIEIPRSSILQAGDEKGKNIEDIKKIESGDLLFFHGTVGHYNEKFPNGIGHVALYTENNKIIHAGSKRIQEKPNIIENGEVEEHDLKEIMDNMKSFVIAKRF